MKVSYGLITKYSVLAHTTFPFVGDILVFGFLTLGK